MKRQTASLSERHRLILAYLSSFQLEKGHSPTLREIGQALGIRSVSLVDYYLGRLEVDGYISRRKISPHRVEITVTAHDPCKDPFPGAGGRSARGELVIIPVLGVLKGECFYPYKNGKITQFEEKIKKIPY